VQHDANLHPAVTVGNDFGDTMAPMPQESKAEREAWTALVEGRAPKKEPKYHNERKGKYASGYEAEVAAKLWTLLEAGKIEGLREQVPFELVPRRGKMGPVIYVADFTFYEDGKWRVCDAKGFAHNRVYMLKKRMMYLVHEIEIEEL
jgi:hypothetical protein